MTALNVHELIVGIMEDFCESVEGGNDFYELEEWFLDRSAKLQNTGVDKEEADLRSAGAMLARLDSDSVLKDNATGTPTPLETDIESIKGKLATKFGLSTDIAEPLSQGYLHATSRTAKRCPNVPVTRTL